jgi:hypothetical protein
MRKALTALAVIVLSAAFIMTTGVTADAAKRKSLTKTGTIMSVSDKTFVCEWNKVKYTYQVTDKTTYRDKGKDGTFADVKVGSVVNIGYHYAGKDRVADWVTIEKRN